MRGLSALVVAALLAACGVGCGVGQDVEGFVVGGAGKLCGAYTWVTDSPDTCGAVAKCTLPDGVYYRATPANQHTNTPEVCWIGDDFGELARALSEKYGPTTCEPSPRGNAFGWPCLYHCGAAGKGCDAYQGCFCD